jgi:hypothetical protein
MRCLAAIASVRTNAPCRAWEKRGEELSDVSLRQGVVVFVLAALLSITILDLSYNTARGLPERVSHKIAINTLLIYREVTVADYHPGLGALRVSSREKGAQRSEWSPDHA